MVTRRARRSSSSARSSDFCFLDSVNLFGAAPGDLVPRAASPFSGVKIARMSKIKAAFEKVVGALEKQPELGVGTGVTTAKIREGLTCDVESGGFRFVSDLPATAGGDGRGPTPGMYGRGALASCLAMGYAMRAARA